MDRSLISLLLVVVALGGVVQAKTAVVDLSGDGWTLQNLPMNISVPARLPSQAHLDLLENRVIGDPYYGFNDFSLRCISRTNWTYVSDPLVLDDASDATWLVFEGLDTFATIHFCAQPVASTNNQFRQYHFDVSGILAGCASKDRVLSLNFGSAPDIADRIADLPGQEVWPDSVVEVFEIPNRQFIRKQQSDFGWDWGPAFAPAGPWLPAYAVQLNHSDLYVRNTLIDIYREGQVNNMLPDQGAPWVVNASLDLIGNLPKGAGLQYELRNAGDNSSVTRGVLENITTVNGAITGSTTVPNGSVDLWWPTGLGRQKLYYLHVSVVDGYNNQTLATSTKRTAFRTIVLNELSVTEDQLARGIAPGNNWHFEINGHPFFAKGSNFIPPDAFWPRVDQERIGKLFDSVVAGKQNMLRVWASGAYSPDFMYDLADEMGILLWSEFEFGDDLYPVDRDFVDNVYEEAVYQVRRVNHHPSLAFWAGGNELENLELANANASDPSGFPRYLSEYYTLFLSTLFPAVFENSRSVSYAPSSTSNGFVSLNFSQAPYFEERLDNLTAGSIYGETDYYNYDSTFAFNSDTYPVGRFSNEFGFHSMPSLSSFAAVLPRAQWRFNSSAIVARNHHNPPGSLSISNHTNSLVGMGQMTLAVQRWYPSPNKTDAAANLTAWAWATQVFQADSYVSQIAFYRRGSGLRQRTLGSLYWQLEDIWQAPSWAGIEYEGRWKVLHHRAADAYANVVCSPFFNYSTGALEVWVTSDLWTPLRSASVDLEWFKWDGTPLPVLQSSSSSSSSSTMAGGGGGRINVTVGALNSTRALSVNLFDALARLHLEPADVVGRVSVEATGQLPNGGDDEEERRFTHTSWLHATPLSAANLVDPRLSLRHDAGRREFVLAAEGGVSGWTWLDFSVAAQGRSATPPPVVIFDDNGFWMKRGEVRRVGYRVVGSGSTGGNDNWQRDVEVRSIWDLTTPD